MTSPGILGGHGTVDQSLKSGMDRTNPWSYGLGQLTKEDGLRARNWMQAVGAIFLLLGVGFIPPINEARVPFAFPFAEGAEGTLLFKAFIDYSFAFGIDLLVLGGFLWWAARRPSEHVWLVWLVVWTEAFRVVGDAWALTRGYPESMNWVFGGFIVFHIAVVVTGVLTVRRERTSTKPEQVGV